jgi:hypothetical protein
VRAGDECGVVVEAGVAAAFVVVESELAFQLPVVELVRPAQAGEPGEPLRLAVGGQVGEPVVSGRVAVEWPFDDQPLGARRQIVVADRVRGDDADEAEAAGEVLARRRCASLRVFLCIGGWLGVVGDAVSEVDA